MAMTEDRILQRHESIKGVVKEYRARKGYLFLLADKASNQLLVSQRLPPLVEHINGLADTPADRVTLSALYKASQKTSARTAGFVKHRWKCTRVSVDDLASVARRVTEKLWDEVVLLGDAKCYVTE